MASRLRPLESAGLYLLILGFSIFFFVAGVMVGRWLPREEEPLAASRELPKEGSEEDLGIYREIVEAGRDDPGQVAVTPPSAGPDTASNLSHSPDSAPPPPAPAGPSFITVQVGAYSDIRTVNSQVFRLGAKGYPYRIIEPGEQGNQAYLIWVESFDSRAGAEALEKRLKEDGFTTFVKPIPGTAAP